MNIIEAIKSGKPFRRKTDHENWMTYNHHSADMIQLYVTDILADDWETKHKPREFWVTITNNGNGLAYVNPINSMEGEVIHVREVLE